MPRIFKKIKKRDGRIVNFDAKKITKAMVMAGNATGEFDESAAKKLTMKVLNLAEQMVDSAIPTVEEIQDIVEDVLLNSSYRKTAKAYILYREQHKRLREIGENAGIDLMDQYLKKADWQVNENSNMTYSLQGLNNYISSEISKTYWLRKVYSPEVRVAHLSGDFHIHDLNILSVYCVGWDLYDLLMVGFRGVSGKIESKPAKHFRTALGQVVNFFYTLQGEAAGAQALANFDTLLAPFIRYDKLSYKEVKQAMQEFIFNMNVPTRVGFQCFSEDTEILSKNGWKKYNEVKKGELIATFNVKKGFIEYLPVQRVFARKYNGKMYNLVNRITDQLISPKHRVVRKLFSVNNYSLEEIESVLKLKSPFIVPVGSEGNVLGSGKIEEDVVKLMAWVIAEGSMDKGDRGSGRISIYQSAKKSPDKYQEIIEICASLGLKYTDRLQSGLGEKCNVIRFDANSTRKILDYFKSDKKIGIKFIPASVLNADTETSRLFLETYIKGDGHDGCKITTTSEIIKDGLLQAIVNAGYGATVLVRKPDNKLSKKDRYILRIIRHKDTYINEVKEIQYNGIIWCPNTKNETVVARRKNKIFISGNTPFTNVTLDLTVSPNFSDKAVLIGGAPQKEKYKDFQKEMDIFNKAFLEVLHDGDAKGRVFTFPIPTYNITKDFNWNNANLENLWKMTAKYGIPYFSNFINSDMKPEDARSMCLEARAEILIRNSKKIKRLSIKEIAENYKIKNFDQEGWAECESKRNLEVLSLNPKNLKLEWSLVRRFLKVKSESGVRVICEDGKAAIFSPKHPMAVYTPEGIKMKFAKDVQADDYLMTLKKANKTILAKKYQKIEDLNFDENLAKILGYFTADGNYLFESRKNYTYYGQPHGMQFTFKTGDYTNINLIKKLFQKVFNITVKEKQDPRYNTYYLYVYNTEISRKLFNSGFKKYGRLPQILFNSPGSIITCFLDFYFKGDGYAKRQEIHINDKALSRDLAILFALIGRPINYKLKENSQRIYLQHANSEIKSGNGWLNTPILSERVPGWMATSTYKVPGLCKSRMVGFAALKKYDAHTVQSLKLKDSDIYLVKIKAVTAEHYNEAKEFYDLELAKNHLFVHSLGQISFNCCRLRLDNRELQKRGGGLFGANPLTGSIGVVTINMARLGHTSKTEEEFFKKLDRLMTLAKESLEVKRKVLERFTDENLYPYVKYYLRNVKLRFNEYWKNHFSTIGLVGMNEACLNFLGEKICEVKGRKFTLKVLDFMRKRLKEFQKDASNNYNLEATPAEGTSYRLAKKDQDRFPQITFANNGDVKKGAEPFYTNSTQLPVNYTDDIFHALDLQDELQTKYTGGTVVHLFVGEKISDADTVKNLVKKICNKYHLPYFTITPTFSICPNHGYRGGEHRTCPDCGSNCEVYSRIVGYLRPIAQWNEGKQEEFKMRKTFKMKEK